MGAGHVGSEPLTMPIGRALINVTTSKNTVWRPENVRTFLPTMCDRDLLMDLMSDSLNPFWCHPSAGTVSHLILFLDAHFSRSSLAATSCEPLSEMMRDGLPRKDMNLARVCMTESIP